MNSLQRYLYTLAGKPVDFVPRLPILMRYAAEYIGSNYAAFASDYRVLTEASLVCARKFGIDQMNTMSDPYRETQGYGAKIIYQPNMVPYCEKHPLEDDEEHKGLSGLPRPDPMKSERMRDRIEAIRRFRDRVGGGYSIMGWVEGPAAQATDLRRMDNFFIDMIEEETYAGDLMDICVDVALEFARLQVESGADTIGIGDAAASQVSAALYEKLILPRQRRLVKGLKALGVKVRVHICGNITHLLPGLSSLDFDVIDVDHMVSLGRVRQELGGRITICGNLDPVADVLKGTPETIRAANEACYAEVGNPYIANAGCEIPSGTPVENLRALCAPLLWKP